MVFGIRSKRESRAENPLNRGRSGVAEVVVYGVVTIRILCKTTPRLVVSSTPRHRKVDILGYVATQSKAECVTDIVGFVYGEVVRCNILEQVGLSLACIVNGAWRYRVANILRLHFINGRGKPYDTFARTDHKPLIFS